MEVGNLPLFLAKRVPQSRSVSEPLGGQDENGSVEVENLVVPELRLSENYRNQDEPTQFSATAQLSQTETGQAQRRGLGWLFAAGDYTFTFDSQSLGGAVRVHGENQSALIVLEVSEDTSSTTQSALVLTRSNGPARVVSMRLAELGKDFHFAVPKAEQQILVQDLNSSSACPWR